MSKELFKVQVEQCQACDIPIVDNMDTWPDLLKGSCGESQEFGIVIDAMFGFSFSGDSIREPFKTIVDDIKKTTE